MMFKVGDKVYHDSFGFGTIVVMNHAIDLCGVQFDNPHIHLRTSTIPPTPTNTFNWFEAYELQCGDGVKPLEPVETDWRADMERYYSAGCPDPDKYFKR